MSDFIILTGIDGNKMVVNVNQAVLFKPDNTDYRKESKTMLNLADGTTYYVRESVTEILRFIEVTNG